MSTEAKGWTEAEWAEALRAARAELTSAVDIIEGVAEDESAWHTCTHSIAAADWLYANGYWVHPEVQP